MAQVNIAGISKSYTEGVPVLRDLSLDIADGELFFLLGPSGCGKSTLLRILAGLIRPDSGTISFDGRSIDTLPPEKRNAAMVFQNYALWPQMDVFDNIAFGLKNAGVRGTELKNSVMEVLELVHLTDCVRRRVPSLSGGQQQRIALARALAVKPALLLLDEPLSNLDARLRDVMRSEIHRICRARHQTALYVTHDRQEALSMADRIGVMHGGVLRQTGTPEELYNYPADPFCAEFLGDVNYLPGRVTGGSDFQTAFGEFRLAAAAHGPCRRAMIRPEHIRFSEDGSGVEAEICERTFLGETCRWRCKILADGTQVVVSESAPPFRKIGEKLRLVFDQRYLLAAKE